MWQAMTSGPPLIEEGRLVGVTTARDLFRAAQSEKWMDIDLHAYPW